MVAATKIVGRVPFSSPLVAPSSNGCEHGQSARLPAMCLSL